ncbi:MAG TPA: vWA domain-containing protein [Polyangiaceae bacterium]|nr:vWA domain-containing protein [Polyangiaceae bacterium]
MTRPGALASRLGFVRAVGAAALVAACSSSHSPTGGTDDSATSTGGAAPDQTGSGGALGQAGETEAPPIIHVDGGTGSPKGCNDIDVGFEKLIPTILLLVDESGSMSDNKYPAGGAQSRWRVLHDALLADGGLVQTLAADVRFGFIGYTGDGTAATCPLLESTDIFEASPDASALSTLRGVYPEERPSLPYSGDTPTGAAFRAATKVLTAYNEPGPKHILLATDGDPDTCAKPNPQCGQEEAVSAAEDAYAAGIGAFVIGISDDVASWHLQQMANAGAGLDVAPPDPNFYNMCPKDPTVTPKYAAAAPAQNAKFYKPADGAELAQVLSSIVNSARTCTFTLHGKVTAGKESQGSVRLDGVAIDYMAPDGWHLLDAQTLEVLGPSCDKIKTTSKLLQVSFPCDSITILR